MDASDHLIKNIFLRKDELIAALGNPNFYVELSLIGIALSLGLLTSMLIRRKVKQHLEVHPLRRIDAEFITKPIALLGPVLALFFLSIAKPIAEEYAQTGGDWTDAAIELCVAYGLAKCVVLVLNARPIAWFIASIIMLIGTLRATGFIHSMLEWLRSISFEVGTFHLSMLNLVHGLVILIVVFWLAGVLSRTLESYLRRSSRLSYNARELTVKFFRVFVYFVALMITLSVVGVDLTAFAVFSGALGVGVGLGLQKITANFVSGITMLMEKSIQLGDLIEIGNITGRVRQLNIRYALVETSDGREVMIPNEELVSTRVTNWTHTNSNARIDIKVTVDYMSDTTKVVALMLEAANDYKLCLKTPEPSCWLREFTDSGLLFLLVFWIPDVKEGRNGPQSDVMLSILDKFRKTGITISVGTTAAPSPDKKNNNEGK